MAGDGWGCGRGKHSGILGYSTSGKLPALEELLQVLLPHLLLLKGQCRQSQGHGDHLFSQETVTAKPNCRRHHKKALGVEGLANAGAGALLQLPSPMVEAQAVAPFAQRTCAPDSQPSCTPVLLCPAAAPPAVYKLEVETVGPQHWTVPAPVWWQCIGGNIGIQINGDQNGANLVPALYIDTDFL